MDQETAARLVGKELICKKADSEWATVVGEKYRVIANEGYGLRMSFTCHDTCKIDGITLTYAEIFEQFDWSILDTPSARIKATLLDGKPLKLKDLLT